MALGGTLTNMLKVTLVLGFLAATSFVALPAPRFDASACGMVIEWGVVPMPFIDFFCVGDCAPIDCEAGLMDIGAGWRACPCFETTPCAGAYNPALGSLACIRNSCSPSEACSLPTLPGPSGIGWAPCLCGQ